MEASRQRGILFLAVAAVLAVLTGVIVISYLNDLERQVGERVEIVVARQSIPARTLMSADMLEMQPIPRQLLRDTYVLDPQDVLRDMVSLIDLQPGDILQRSFLDRNAGLKPGMRAVSVGINRVTGVGGTIRPGNRVDVIVSYKQGDLSESVPVTELLFQDVEVLGVSTLSSGSSASAEDFIDQSQQQAPSGTSPGGSAQPAQQTEDIPPARFSAEGDLLNEATITLALPIDEALKIAWMEQYGDEIRLVIRRLDEKELPPAPPISPNSFR